MLISCFVVSSFSKKHMKLKGVFTHIAKLHTPFWSWLVESGLLPSYIPMLSGFSFHVMHKCPAAYCFLHPTSRKLMSNLLWWIVHVLCSAGWSSGVTVLWWGTPGTEMPCLNTPLCGVVCCTVWVSLCSRPCTVRVDWQTVSSFGCCS